MVGGDDEGGLLDADEVTVVKEGRGRVEILPLTPGRSTTAVLQKLKT